jgi:hypothetical protein
MEEANSEDAVELTLAYRPESPSVVPTFDTGCADELTDNP